MPRLKHTHLAHRAVLLITGPDRVSFLQGLLSQDMALLKDNTALYGCLLTAQGKFLHDLFLYPAPDGLFLEGEAARLDDLLRRLLQYKLRAQVKMENLAAALTVHALYGEDALDTLGLPTEAGRAWPFAGGLVAVDPRLSSLGARAILRRDFASDDWIRRHGFSPAPLEDYDFLRFRHDAPDGSREMAIEKTTPLEANIDRLNGVSFSKGCYVGQELTARMHYRGLLKRRFKGLGVMGGLPAPNSPVFDSGGVEVGEWMGGSGPAGLALLKIDCATTDLQCGEARLHALA